MRWARVRGYPFAMPLRPAPFPRPKVSGEGHRVTTFELLFDLVFVFAFTQVTESMAESHSAIGVLRAMVILLVLWWSWCSYSWLANQTHVDEGVMRVGMSVAMVAMFVIALVIPEAFDDLPGGLSGPLVFAIAFIVVRVVHIVLYLLAAGDDTPLRRQVLRTSISMIIASALILTGALVGGTAQTWFWLAGVTADVGLAYLTSTGGNWRLNSPAHWSERYGLVVILALGESIVAVGVGAAQEPVSVPILLGAVLGVLLSIALWWLYFDVVAGAAERQLARRNRVARAALATDAYTYLHFVLIGGIVLSALGVEEVLAHATGTAPLGLFAAAALLGGTAAYLAGHAFFWRRVGGRWTVFRLAGAALLLALVPVAAVLQPLVALAGVTGIVAAVTAAEARHRRSRRAQLPASARGSDS